MEAKFALLLLAAVGCVSIASAEKKHPGCAIWWFAPGCFLGDNVAVDPFRIYPWDQFCLEYTAFADEAVCEEYLAKEDKELDEEEAAYLVEKDMKEEDAADAEHHERPKRSKESVKVMGRMFLKKSLKKGRNGKGKETPPCKGVSGCKAKRFRQRRAIGAMPGTLYRPTDTRTTHPGCGEYWFLPGCPLGEMVGVDPFNSYNWDYLCRFESLQPSARCRLLPFPSLSQNYQQ